MSASSTNNNAIIIDVYSDLACPWCYVGLMAFRLARESFSKQCQTPIKVKLHPYIIDPATKSNGEEYLAYNRRRWGGDGWTYDLRSSGQRVGCTFSSWKTWPNTLLAHCLVSAVDEKDSAKAEETYLRLLKLSYEEGENISDSATLSRVAAEAGLAGDEWRSEKWKRCVLEEDQRAKQEMDIHGVPRWFVSSTQKPGQRVELDGAVSVDRFLRALNQFRSN